MPKMRRLEAEPELSPALATLIAQSVQAVLEPLASSLQQLNAQVQELQKAREDRAPFPISDRPIPSREVMDGGAGTRTIERSLPMTPDGKPLSQREYERWTPKFQNGDRVKLNPDYVCGGRITHKEIVRNEAGKVIDVQRTIEPQTWGDVMARLGVIQCRRPLPNRKRCTGQFSAGQQSCPYCGNGPQVLSAFWVSKEGVWKYRVRFPGLTSNVPSGFKETELLPLDAAASR